ncbi:hypothetical protein SBY92_003692 [Candida maltosa Xu316]|uniref:Retrograde transport protein Dsl1 C-terminal domain-containing protein n=1 Tax=Candida maltosa (strain Xu316) TaxID=1245528 RepID=M3K4J1_CANMX|nr:hypothetical protein G210_4786 [Candida maltosa Xu316]
MTTFEKQLQEQTSFLATIEDNISKSIAQINRNSLLKNHDLADQYQEIQDVPPNDLATLSLSQLNYKYESVTQDIKQLEVLQSKNLELQEIEGILGKPKTLHSLLDFQHVNNLLKGFAVDTSSSLMIYKQMNKKLESLKQSFVSQLDDYLVILLIPDLYTLENISMLDQFNTFIIKNGYELTSYAKYKEGWDKLADTMLKENKVIELNFDEDNDTMHLQVSEAEGPFIKSAYNLIKFINEVKYPSIKNYINSKLSKQLMNKISTNINEIVNDQTQMTDLHELVTLCQETNWNVLTRIEGGGSLKEKLNKLHVDWIVDNYIEKIKKVFKSEAIKQTETTKVCEENKPTQEKTSEKDEPQQEEDGWDDGWDDNWDDDEEDNKKEEQKQEEEAGETVTITKVPSQLLSIIQDFQQHSNDLSHLITSIQMLALVAYPSLSNSFLMFNDLNYLAQKIPTGQHELQQFANYNWNQAQIRFYQDLKEALSLLNLDDEDSTGSEPDELDDYNINQISLIYKWFQNLFDEKQLNSTNKGKFVLLVTDLVEFINKSLVQMVLSFEDTNESQCTKITHIIDNINNVTVPYILQLNVNKDTIESYHKLNNVKFLVSRHLNDIMERFYEGELYDLETPELVRLIKAVFVQSEMRDNYINEIIEFRNMN